MDPGIHFLYKSRTKIRNITRKTIYKFQKIMFRVYKKEKKKKKKKGVNLDL